MPRHAEVLISGSDGPACDDAGCLLSGGASLGADGADHRGAPTRSPPTDTPVAMEEEEPNSELGGRVGLDSPWIDVFNEKFRPIVGYEILGDGTVVQAPKER